ncbi:transposase [Bradyrhizobium sp. BRP22]|uniref:IS66 family transposase n=1 Tax=Bradyrhizobium sp. BRP22 TaxID=2793821 RepID=UPI001CD4A5F4|nr:transposase [Bradyrhizobium sp. BRP22]
MKATNYCLRRWDAFLRFLDAERPCMSNNAAERELRTVAIGRRNWSLAGFDEGGRPSERPSRYLRTTNHPPKAPNRRRRPMHTAKVKIELAADCFVLRQLRSKIQWGPRFSCRRTGSSGDIWHRVLELLSARGRICRTFASHIYAPPR